MDDKFYYEELRDLVLKLYPTMLQHYPNHNLSARLAITIQTADEMLRELNNAIVREQKRRDAYSAVANAPIKALGKDFDPQFFGSEITLPPQDDEDVSR